MSGESYFQPLNILSKCKLYLLAFFPLDLRLGGTHLLDTRLQDSECCFMSESQRANEIIIIINCPENNGQPRLSSSKERKGVGFGGANRNGQ